MCTTLYAGFLESTIIFAMAHFHSIALYLGSHCNTTHSLQSDITKHDLVLASLHVNLSGKNRDHRHIAFLKVSNMQIITLFAFMTLLKDLTYCVKGHFFSSWTGRVWLQCRNTEVAMQEWRDAIGRHQLLCVQHQYAGEQDHGRYSYDHQDV